jgi:ribosomal protein S27AE
VNNSVAPAKVVVVNGDREWHCPNCGTKLAAIIGARVVIRVRERLISLRSDVEPDQVCWKCGTTSYLGKDGPHDLRRWQTNRQV